MLYAVRKSNGKVYRLEELGLKHKNEISELKYLRVESPEVDGVESKYLENVDGVITEMNSNGKKDIDSVDLDVLKSAKIDQLYFITLRHLVETDPTYIVKKDQIDAAKDIEELEAIDLE